MPGQQRIVVTGFGPFGEHKVNASWVVVQELAKLGFDEENLEIVITEIPVTYEDVKEIIPELWKKHDPLLMVHVGVSGYAVELTLEQLAHNDGYNKLDVLGCVPHTGKCVDDCCSDTLYSDINMSVISQSVGESPLKVSAIVSKEPGRYLCDFSYFVSLNIKRDRAAFVHVPPLNSPYSATEMAECLKFCIKEMLKQIQHS